MNNKQVLDEEQCYITREIKVENNFNIDHEEQFEPYLDDSIKIEETCLDTNITKYECDICGGIFSNLSSLKHHVNEVHQNDSIGDDTPVVRTKKQVKLTLFKCDYPNCGKCFKTQYKLKYHVAVHNNNKPFKCGYSGCTKSFRGKRELIAHALLHNDDRPFKCEQTGCGKLFKRKYDLKVHMRVHSSEKPFKCKHDGCVKSFKSNLELNSHMRVHSVKKQFFCEQTGCSKSFKSKGELSSHMRVHSYEKLFRCDHDACGKMFKRKKDLNAHSRVHSLEKPFMCKQTGCIMAFKSKAELNSHIKVHCDKKPFKCDHTGCMKSFKRISDLNGHMKVHLGEILFKCTHNSWGLAYKWRTFPKDSQRPKSFEMMIFEYPSCDSSFQWKQSYRKHMRLHNIPSQYSCTFENCGAIFEKIGSLADHVKSHTGDELSHRNILSSTYENCLKKTLTNEKQSDFESPSCNKDTTQLVKSTEKLDELILYSCAYPNCKVILKTIQDLKSHARVHNQFTAHDDDDDKSYQCPHKSCDKAFQAETNLKIHLQLHNDNAPYKCTHDGCGEAFKRKSYRDFHQISHELETDPYKVLNGIMICNFPGCKSKFIEINSSYYKHMQQHKLGKRYCCTFDQCDAAFFESKELRNHSRVHTGERFMCGHEGCDRSYLSKQTLNSHQETHSGRTFPCSFGDCPKTFNSNHQLSNHLIIHKKKVSSTAQ